MKRVFAHFTRLLKKVGFILFFALAISPVAGLGLLVLSMAISLLFFKDPVSKEDLIEDVLNNFTEDELEIIFAEKVDDKVSDDDYLTLVAKYQSLYCSKKLDGVTTWVGSAVNKDSFIFLYELNDRRIDGFDVDKQKEGMRKSITKNNVQTLRVISSGRGIIFRYTFKYSGETFDVVFSNEELKNL